MVNSVIFGDVHNSAWKFGLILPGKVQGVFDKSGSSSERACSSGALQIILWLVKSGFLWSSWLASGSVTPLSSSDLSLIALIKWGYSGAKVC